MKIENALYHKTISPNETNIFFDDRKEVIFLWRSNVWKSSIMNSLLEKKDLVKTSSKPWRTRTTNLFLVNNKFYFTDLPGYWFAKLDKISREKIDNMISWYLEERKNHIKIAFLLIDSRLWAQEKDIDMYKYIKEIKLNPIIVLTKTDKLSKNELSKSLAHTSKIFFWEKIYPYSIKTDLSKKEISKEISASFKN